MSRQKWMQLNFWEYKVAIKTFSTPQLQKHMMLEGNEQYAKRGHIKLARWYPPTHYTLSLRFWNQFGLIPLFPYHCFFDHLIFIEPPTKLSTYDLVWISRGVVRYVELMTFITYQLLFDLIMTYLGEFSN